MIPANSASKEKAQVGIDIEILFVLSGTYNDIALLLLVALNA